MPADLRPPARRWRQRLHLAFVVALVATLCVLVARAPDVQAAIQTYADDFATYDYTGSTGTHPWASDWIDGEGDGPAGGAITIRDEPHCETDPCAVIGWGGADNATLERGVDLSAATSATITFDYQVHVHGLGAGAVEFQASADGGGVWDTLATYDLTADTAMTAESIDLDGYRTSNARIRFEVQNGADDSHLSVDNIRIAAGDDVPANVVISEFSHRNDHFIELYNAGAEAVDIDGYEVRLNGPGVSDITVSQGGAPVILVSGGHYLLARSGSGLDGIADQTFGFNLSSSMGIRLRDTDSNVLDEVGLEGTSWFETNPLPNMPGGGVPQSYERLNTGGLGNCVDTDDNRADFVHNLGFSNPESRADAPVPCGSATSTDHVVISEFRPEGPNGGDDEFVEIFNPTAAAVDISGWKFHITEPGLFLDYHVVPAGTVLEPGEHYLLSNTDGPSPSNAQPYDVPVDYFWSWGDVVLKDDLDTIVDVLGYGSVANGQMYEGTAQLPYEGAFSDRSLVRRHGGKTDTDNNLFDFVLAFDATPTYTNLAPLFDQDLGDRTDPEGALVTFGAGATDLNPADTLTYSATGLPEGIRIDPASGEITGALGPNSAGVYNVAVTVTDDGAPVRQAVDVFTWTVTAGEVAYLIPGWGGTDGGDDLLTAVDLTNPDPATNETNIGTGTGTWLIRAAAIQHDTGALYAADGDELGRIDVTTGRFNPIGGSFGVGDGSLGAVDLDGVRGIAFHPLTGELFAVHGQLGASLVFQVDPATGALIPGTFAGDDYAVVPGVGVGAVYVTDLAFHPTTQELYAVMTDYFGEWFLVTIDPTSGTSATIGATGGGIHGLSFTAAGDLWGVGSTVVSTLERIDLVDGSTSDSRIVDNGGFYEAAAFSAPKATNSAPTFDQDLTDRTDAEGDTVSIPSPATDPNVGDTLVYTATGLPSGISIDPGSGLISGTIDPLAGAGSPYNVTITVTDNGAPPAQDVDTFTWTITDVNRPPALDPIADSVGDELTLITFTATGSDPDLDGVTFSLSGAPAGATIGGGTGVFAWTPTEAQDGTYTFDVVLTDDGIPVMTDVQTITVTVDETNQAPSITNPGDQSSGEGDAVNLPISVVDTDDPANTLAYAAVGLPPGLAIDPGSGLISGTVGALAASGSPYSVTVTVTDDGVPNLQDQVVFSWAVADTNRSPVLDPIADPAGDELTLITFTAVASDPDNDGFSFSLVGEPEGATIDPATGVFEWTPTEVQDGTYAFDVVVTDDGLPPLSASRTIIATVNDINLAPALDPLVDLATDEAVELTFTATASDPDGDPLTFSLLHEPAGATIDPLTGAFTWTPGEDQQGTHTFKVIVTDAGVPPLDDKQYVTITVGEVNEAPTLVAPADRIDHEGDSVSLPVPASDPDLPADTLIWSAANLPPGLTIDPGTGVISGTVSYEASAGSPYVVTVAVVDGNGGECEHTFTWKVKDTNRAPVVSAIPTQRIEPGESVSFTVRAKDPDGDPVTYGLGGSAPSGARIAADSGAFVWSTRPTTPPGTYTFSVTATDDAGAAGEARVSIIVQAPNAAPVAIDTVLRVEEDTSAEIVLDAADDDGDELTWQITVQPSLGTLTGGGQRWTYRPRADVNGTDTVEFAVADPTGATASGLVTIEIIPVNDAPTAEGERYEVERSSELAVDAPGVLANDHDIDDSEVIAELDRPPAHGTLELTAAGGFRYVPDDAFVGEVDFTYRIVDPSGAAAGATVVIAVTAPPAVSSPQRRVAVDAINDFSWDEGAPLIVATAEDATAVETVERTLVLMTRASGVAVQQMGFPFILLLAAGFAVISLGRLRVIPLFGRRRKATGIVQTYSPEHGFGLVRADGEGQDLFVHRSALRLRDRDRIRPGDRVKFRIVDGEHRDLATRLRFAD